MLVDSQHVGCCQADPRLMLSSDAHVLYLHQGRPFSLSLSLIVALQYNVQ